MEKRNIDRIEVGIFVIIMTVVCALMSCGQRFDVPNKQETITTDVVITDVTVSKYSVVKGIVVHNGISMNVDNGTTGYYYKRYNLAPNQIIKQNLTFSYYNDYKGYVVMVNDLDVTQYEQK